MKFKTNKISDIREYYVDMLIKLYSEKEAGNFLDLIFDEYFSISRINRQLNPDYQLSESELLKVHFAVKQLKIFRPIQYIFGKADFFGLKFFVDENVLIPRPETEELVQWIIDDYSDTDVGLKVLDIGTGSGCIAISLKKTIPGSQISALDISENALEIARKNASLNKVEIDFLHMDILNNEAIDKLNKFDVIDSNPPYVREQEKHEISKNVKDYEPAQALFVDNNDPLVFYRHIAKAAKKLLNPGGKLFLEINQYLGKETLDLLQASGFSELELRKDINGNDRMIRCSNDQ